jgi:hypothetical protein
MYETSHEISYLYIRNSALQDRGKQRPLRAGPIGLGRRRGDAHIVGYYALEQRVKPREGLGVWGGAKRRALEAVLVALASAPVSACVDGGLVNLPRCVRVVALVLPL